MISRGNSSTGTDDTHLKTNSHHRNSRLSTPALNAVLEFVEHSRPLCNLKRTSGGTCLKMLIGFELSTFALSPKATDAKEARNVALFGWDGAVSTKHPVRGSTRTFAMTNRTVCHLLKTLAALALTATFSSTSFAGEFTVQQGKRYRATLSLNSVERLADNSLIERKFRALGFSGVRVSGTGAIRRVEGVWPRKDASAPLPPQIVAVARL
jgi:hypothetical protein